VKYSVGRVSKLFKSIVYFILSLALLFYGVPRIPMFDADDKGLLFSAVWLFFALLIVGAHLDQLIGLDEEKRDGLKLKKVQRLKKEQEVFHIQRKRGVM